MKIVAPHFFDVPIKERRLVFMRNSDKQCAPVLIANESPRAVEGMDPYMSRLASEALENFLSNNPKISEFFESSGTKSSEHSLWNRAFQNIYKRLGGFLNSKREAGVLITSDFETGSAELIAEKICEVAHLISMINVDPLTGLPDRRAFDLRLEEEIEKSGSDKPLCLLMFDLDKFKEVNDTHGHPAGDEVLRELAKCFRAEDDDNRILRETDLVARYGTGDEVAILLSNTDSEVGCLVANRISQRIKQRPFKVGSNGSTQKIYLTASIGVSQYQGRDVDPDGKKMIKSADECLYLMKDETPDENGVKVRRRGQIACDGRIKSDKEIRKILAKHPQKSMPIDRLLIDNRDRIMRI